MRFEHTLDQWYNAVCCVKNCNETIPWNAPAPVCRPHGIEIAEVYYTVVEHRKAKEARAHLRATEEKKPVELRKDGREVVYYVQIADYVKIGYTRRLRERIRQLRANFEDLLAIEDGDRALESQRHQQFRSDRLDIRRENFRPSPALLEHIESLGGRTTLPDWAKRPDTRKLRLSGIE